ncbi:MAG: DUF11 domain-containing protein [Acidobacteriota bacterium]|nr:MAG: DUF11 domain-containing protein [Acidobacteriota bacterium]
MKSDPVTASAGVNQSIRAAGNSVLSFTAPNNGSMPWLLSSDTEIRLIVARLFGAGTNAWSENTAAFACGASTVTTLSPPYLYIDTATLTTVSAEYVGYRICNDTGANISDAWVRLTAGGAIVTLAANEDGLYHIGPLMMGQCANAYFYVKMSGETAVSQTLTVDLFDGNPGSGGTLVCGGNNFGYTVEDVIDANANKPDSVTVSGDTNACFTVTATGATGNIGSHNNYNITYTPAAHPSWPADAYELTAVNFKYPNGPVGGVDHKLFVDGLTSSIYEGNYVITYTFCKKQSVALPSVAPYAYIASGSNNNKYGPLDPAVAVQLTALKIVSPMGAQSPGTALTYTITINNTGSVNATLMTLVDSIPTNTTYVAGSTTLNGAAVPDNAGPTMPYSVSREIHSPGEPSGTINAGESAVVSFQVTINNPLPMGVTSVSNVATYGSTDTPPTVPQTNTNEVVTPITLTPALSIVKTAMPTTYSMVGQTINYSYLVTNSGNTTLAGPFTVNDDKATDEMCPATASLAPGASITCTASYTITQADIDAGSVTNIASATNGVVTSPTDTETVMATQSPALSIVKSAMPTTYSAVGNVISYSYLVTNSGNTTLAGPFTVNDDKATDEMCPATASLAPGASITCTASYTITQADIDAGSVTNIASATNGVVTSPTDTETVTATQSPALSIVKTAMPMTYSAVGNVISYSYLVTNSGNTTLAGPFTVNDDKATDEMCPATASLAPGASITCTASYTITQADIDAGSVTNIASATNGVVTSPTDTETVMATQSPALSIVKSAMPTTYSAVGNVISYSYLVTNSGNTTLAGPFTVNDDKATDEMCPATASLAPGASITCTASYTITQADIDAGSVTNIASATNGVVTSPTDTETVTATQSPALSIVKTAMPMTYSAVGNVISYSYLVTNSGNTTLAGPFTVNDDKATDEMCPATASLAPGASITCTASYTITQADIDAGSVTNIASATNGVVTSPTDTETVMATQSPALSIVKTAMPMTYSAVGNVISYSYLVTNSGNTTLAGPFTVNDDKATDEMCPATASLAPGASITCTASYTITQADIDAGSVTNIASATNGVVTSPTDTETVMATQSPALSIVKSAMPTTYSAVGNVISYSYLVTNSGNTTLAGPFTVNDDKATDEMCPATASLAPGASITCTASYTITQADIDAGSVTNIASATNGVVTSPTDTETVTATQSPALSIVKTAMPMTYSAVGNVISYSYLVTNSGNTTLAGPFTVNDDKATDEMCPATASLAPGASITCTASYTITQADIDAGSVTNIASATNGVVTSPTDTETVMATQSPALSIVKTAMPMTYSAVGNVISYSYLVTNSGNTTLAGPFTVNDDKATDEMCPATASLAPGASITCTASYTITQADIDAGSVTNIASATNGVVTSPTDTETVMATQNPALSIVKTAMPMTYSAVGNVISYSYLVTNSGNTTLAGPFTVNDDKATDEMCPATASLAPGASITCTASYTITQADIDAGSVTNIASATNGVVTSPTDTETVTATQSPALSIVKTAMPMTYSAVGNVISYSYLVTNSGNTTLAGPFTVNDDKATDEMCPATASLAPGASITCTASYTITQADIDAGSVTNIASATNGVVTSPTDTETVMATQNPALSIVKTAMPMTYSAVGNVISYSYLVTNSGNTTLAGPFTVNDDKATDEMCPATASLAPGASITCTASYTITQADIDAGSVTNIASATNGVVTSPTDTETVMATQNPALSIVKTAMPMTYSAVGNVISYSYLVTNSGNTTLAGPFTVNDDKATDEMCPATASLAPGASITCTASYTITQADIDAGSVTNIASATNGVVTSPTDTETVTATQSPALSIVKSAMPTTYSAVGNVISYSYLVTNSGNTTLAGPFTVNDDKATDEMCPATASLAPGASITCTASYTITQADIDAGSVTNIASATNGVVTSPTDTETVMATQSPALSIVKTAMPMTYSAVGNVISYSYLVTNSGNTTLAGPFTVNDDKATDEMCPATASLAPGASITCTASYTITQADIDAGSVTNIASATNGVVTSPTDTETVMATQSPALSIVKTAMPMTYSAVGNVISYSYLVTNSGNTTLAGPFTVNDDKATDEACPATASLVPGASITCTASYTITQADIDAGSVTNIASATNGVVTSPTDTETVMATQSPALSIVKTAMPMTYSAVGNVISYSYLVTNSGNTTLAGPFTVNDDKATDEMCPATASLAPGASITCTASYTITQADIDAGSVTNIASATNGVVTSPTDTETVIATQSPALSIVKSAMPTTYSAVGNVISYSYLVTNSGNTTLAGPFTVNDDKATDEMCPATASLAPGASITCTASYTITQADIDAGSVTNIASATNGVVTSPTDTETVMATQSPALSIVKSAMPTTYSAVGNVISYSYLVTNSGNTTLAGPFTVNDDKATDEACPATASLAPGGMITCTASYTITQADIDAGSVTNIASATNGVVTSPTDTETVTATQTRTISLVKTATPSTYDSVGDMISYSYKVTNTGNVTLAGPVTVVDNKATVTCPAGSLAPGGMITCTASYAITQADLDAGSVTNTAKASANGVESNEDSETVTATQTRTISLDKTATPAIYDSVGDTISYSYKVTNTGNVTLAGPVTVVDNKATVTCPAGSLAPGGMITCTASYTITQADLDAGSVTNTAKASANGVESNEDSETVTATQTRTISLVKTATPSTYDSVGDMISYSYKVTNTGNVTLAGPVTVVDNKATVTCPAGSLARAG